MPSGENAPKPGRISILVVRGWLLGIGLQDRYSKAFDDVRISYFLADKYLNGIHYKKQDQIRYVAKIPKEAHRDAKKGLFVILWVYFASLCAIMDANY